MCKLNGDFFVGRDALIKEKANGSSRWNTVGPDNLGESRGEGVRLKNSETGKEWTMESDGVLLAIGWVPNTSLFRGQLDMDENGYIVSPSGVETSVKGVFVAGDLNDTKYRQLVTACGSGCMAALEAGRYLDVLKDG